MTVLSTEFLTAANATGDTPTDADFANLERRWIDRDLAEAAGIRRVISETGRMLVGRKGHASCEGLAIPYCLPGESHVREWRLRRDHPDLEYHDGTHKERGKYLSPPGRKNMIYFPPGTSKDDVTNIALPIVITEGEFKTLALSHLAIHESSVPRFLALGLAGVWNWRGTVGKSGGPNGERRHVKGPIPDLDLVAWAGRRVIIAFDADAENNEQVEAARNQLARELRTRGAVVAFINWNVAQGKGIDDLLANTGPDKVLELLDGADFEKTDGVDVNVPQLADLITARHRFAQDAGGRLYVFRDGVYRSDGATFIRQEVKLLLKRLRLSWKWSSHKTEEVLRYITVDAPLLRDRPSVDIVNVLNGLLDVNTKILSPHSADYLSPVQLPITYDPEAGCASWCKFVQDVFPTDAQSIAWEIAAWLMTPDTSIQKAVLLTGDGANGKSTYLRGVLAFIGKQNVSAVSLQRLENDRFSAARLVGKLANICSDLPKRRSRRHFRFQSHHRRGRVPVGTKVSGVV